MRADGVLCDAVPDIAEDLRLLREMARPPEAGLERVRVKVRRDVARRPGIVVLAPDAADIGGTLEDGERVDARFLQGDRHRDAAKTATCYDHVRHAERYGLARNAVSRIALRSSSYCMKKLESISV